MKSQRKLFISSALLCLFICSAVSAQSPSVLYTWPATGSVNGWFKNFGTNTITLDNNTLGELTITETGTVGTGFASTDDFNRVRETPSGPSGGLDLTGLSNMEFDLGHNGSGPVNVQFFVQASTGNNFVALGGDVAVAPGVSTYSVPLAALTGSQKVYVRTLGINVRDHVPLGNLTWTLREVRSAGTPLTVRTLQTFNTGTSEGGLQGALVNFDNAAVLGNNGGQNQTGLSQDPADSGSLQWTDLGGQNGAAISFGNGTALNGNTFNNRTTDLSNYGTMHLRIKATEVQPGAGGSVNVQPFFQKNGFGSFQSLATQSLPIDGVYHDFYIPGMKPLTTMNVVDQTGLNLGAHPADILINVDLVQFLVPEPASVSLVIIGLVGCLGMVRRSRR